MVRGGVCEKENTRGSASGWLSTWGLAEARGESTGVEGVGQEV